MSTTDERATLIYAFLHQHLGQKFTLAELLARTSLQPGAKTTAAIRKARDRATAEGLHFPPAVPANGFTYTVTALAMDAVEPTVHMRKIEAGVRHRAEVGADFMAANRAQLSPDMREALEAERAVRAAFATAQRAVDDMVVALARSAKEVRAASNGQGGAA